MAFLTDRKRASGLGSAKSGAAHHWHMMMTSYALLVLTPLFLFVFGASLGDSHAEVLEKFQRPFPAIITGLMLVVGFNHFRHGVQALIEDYTHGFTRQILIIAMACLSYGAMATGLFALVRLAL